MRKARLRGVARGKPVFTTVTDPADQRPADLVNRQFKASAPNRLWIADITFVRAWQGFCYTELVTDVCTRKIVGWAVFGDDAHRRPAVVGIQSCCVAIESDLSELVHHSDRGSPYLSLTYTDRLAELGIGPSVGLVAIVMTTPLPKRSTPPTSPSCQPRQALAVHRRRRTGNRPMGGLVQAGTPARSDRLPESSRVRGSSHRHLTPPGASQTRPSQPHRNETLGSSP
jgi:hypothetical protein